MSNNLYNEDSIQKLDPLSFTRLRPDTYLGSNEDSTQLAREIISNCSDEFLIGHCDEVIINYNEKDNIITIADNGQGILPNVKKEGNKTILEMVYGDINSSGKYSRDKDAIYKISTGAFGIGATLTNFLSHWLIAETKRDGKSETVHFKEGKFYKRDIDKCSINEHGVTVSFQPSEEFFRNKKINITKLKNELFNLSCVCAGLKFIFNGEEIYHPNGITDILNIKLEKEINLINTFSFQEKNEKQSLDFCMSLTSKSSTEIIPFCNYSLIEAGTPVTSIKSTITRTLNKWAKEQKLIKDNLTGNSLQEGMIIVFNLASASIRYDSQTKVRVTSTEDNSFISSTLGEQLELWLDNNPEDGKIIIEKALIAKKAAEAAKKARERVRNTASKQTKKNKFMDMPSKLADCYEKDRSKCEIYLTEGDSASGGCKTIRDASTQAIMGLRGKILNTLTSTPEGWHKNQEIMNIVQALGFSWSKDGKEVLYQENKLRYDKFIIAADRDSDGSHIQTLILTMVWTLFPDLILNGHVYIALPPLYKAEWGTKYQYLDNKKALDEFKKTHSSFTLTYFKG